MKVIIPYRQTEKDLEIKYALRSLDKYVSGIDQVVIVGEMPKGIKNVNFIPHGQSNYINQRQFTICDKTLKGIENIKGDFLFYNDDHYILKPIQAKDFPTHHKGELIRERNGTRYMQTIRNTIEITGAHFMNYDTHSPIIFNADKYRKTFEGMKFPEWGYCLKTLYCWFNNVEGEYCQDLKLENVANYGQLDDRLYFSTMHCNFTGFEQMMNELYPEPSKYEI